MKTVFTVRQKLSAINFVANVAVGVDRSVQITEFSAIFWWKYADVSEEGSPWSHGSHTTMRYIRQGDILHEYLLVELSIGDIFAWQQSQLGRHH
jgi:hypothetical protein